MATKNANNQVKENIEAKLARYFGVVPAEATRDQMYKAVAMTVKDILTQKRGDFNHEVNEKGAKRVYYMCVEFLLGRSLKTGICNLGMSEDYAAALKDFGYTLEDIYECEPDAGLGNGGLGRLAACFMDSLSSLDYPATGFSICYDYGFFIETLLRRFRVGSLVGRSKFPYKPPEGVESLGRFLLY